jgi:hypothetical protein
MSRGPDAATLLARALTRSAAVAECPVTIVTADWSRWASATFTGARHSVTLSAPPSPALIAWIATLPEAELVLRGHLVADLSVAAARHVDAEITIELEILTVEER